MKLKVISKKKIVKYFDWVQTVSSLKHAKLLDNQCNIQNKNTFKNSFDQSKYR